MSTKITSSRRHWSLVATVPSGMEMVYIFVALAATSVFFFIVLLPFIPLPALQIVALAAGTAVIYLIRHSPRILRRASLALADRRIRSTHDS